MKFLANQTNNDTYSVKIVDDWIMPDDKLDISQLKSLFDNSLQGIFVVHDQEIIYVNDALCMSLGMEMKDCKGDRLKTLATHLAPRFAEEAVERYLKLASGEMETLQSRQEFVTTSGEKRFLDMNANRASFGGETIIIVFTVDATLDQVSRDALTIERKAYNIIAEAALSTGEIEYLCNRILTNVYIVRKLQKIQALISICKIILNPFNYYGISLGVIMHIFWRILISHHISITYKVLNSPRVFYRGYNL